MPALRGDLETWQGQLCNLKGLGRSELLGLWKEGVVVGPYQVIVRGNSGLPLISFLVGDVLGPISIWSVELVLAVGFHKA